MKTNHFLNTHPIDNTLLSPTNKIKSFKLNENTITTKTKEDEALKEQTDAFEAIFLKQILDISLKNQNSLFGKDASDEIYSSLYNDTMSKALSGGLGFSKLLYDFLKERG
ncbi:rod-binding protein [Campylobacter hepaticus]|uniref:Rod-binding protein n=1 Tax=Campylobacter hepaticus TaxID=1813019 RepID=A0A424YYN2_9BACT|nr:rod-binding protein [Campylobacter hepaticus]AXP09067.1 hypothetical protein A2J15_005070 [Campylobacter hepaticus]MCZ0771888.1 rod-binding protein [Campylobacter hepaticus]MCZ0773023.1 rod-binding protein [Campylobacter hepaticus]MCZ0773357.1 rod-binding protein [Campylobacter hepaticus]MCZ0774608.1 rod-binding protein [Campylobacter hepaticus]